MVSQSGPSRARVCAFISSFSFCVSFESGQIFDLFFIFSLVVGYDLLYHSVCGIARLVFPSHEVPKAISHYRSTPDYRLFTIPGLDSALAHLAVVLVESDDECSHVNSLGGYIYIIHCSQKDYMRLPIAGNRDDADICIRLTLSILLD